MSSAASSDLPWIQLLRIRECFGYQVQRKSGDAYYCEAWKLDQPLFTGELHVMSRGTSLLLRLVHPHSGELFADSAELNCRTVNKPTPLISFIEGVRDSSRYFVIKIRDPSSKRALPFGIGFRERSSSFDLRAAIDDRIRQVQREDEAGIEEFGSGDLASKDINERMKELKLREAKELEDAEKRLAEAPKLDLSLKPGERIKIQMKNAGKTAAPATEGDLSGEESDGESPSKDRSKKSVPAIPIIGGKLLAPPPEPVTQKKIEPLAPPPAAATSAAAGEDDEWAEFTSAN